MSDIAPVTKNVIYAGQKYVPITEGSKVHFHFQTRKLDNEKTLIDDSKKIGKKEPMVLVIGRKFKLEIWETIVQMMAVGEVSSFHVKKELLFSYPFVSKTLRELGQDHPKHLCAMSLRNEGIGYADLDDIMADPCDLEFIIELLKVEKPNEYERDTWQLTVQERLDFIPTLKERGNKFYKQKLYKEAEFAYCQAIGLCEQLMLRERENDEDWIKLNAIKLPILLNYAQCRLIIGEYYDVIEHCTTVLQYDKENEKALFRRAKAHIGVWNPDEAEEDFIMLKSLNTSMMVTVDKELENIRRLRKEKEDKDRDALKKLFELHKIDTC